MRTHVKRILACLAVLAIGSAAAPSLAGDSIKKALSDGSPLLDVRYRLETVDRGGVQRDGAASTARLRLGYETDTYHDFFGLAEFEALRTVGGETYNSTANDKLRYPVVVDPEDEEVNRIFLGYKWGKDRTFKLGRQRIMLDNHRFWGNVGWRQLEQTMDAFSFQGKATPRLNVFYARVNNVNTIKGENHPDPAQADIALSADLFNANWTCSAGKTTGYVYLVEYDDMPMLSYKDIGVRFAGQSEVGDDLDVLYVGEYADQSDYERGAPTIDADYHLLQVGVRSGRWTYTLSYEGLSGDGTYAFSTPFATGHKFNGWADKFLTTPLGGLHDVNVTAERKGKKSTLVVRLHDFDSDAGSMDYGRELDAMFVRPFGDTYTLGLKFAKYDAEDLFTNTEKFMVWLQAKI